MRPSSPGMYATWARPWNGTQVVLAVRVQRDVAHHHHLVVVGLERDGEVPRRDPRADRTKISRVHLGDARRRARRARRGRGPRRSRSGSRGPRARCAPGRPVGRVRHRLERLASVTRPPRCGPDRRWLRPQRRRSRRERRTAVLPAPLSGHRPRRRIAATSVRFERFVLDERRGEPVERGAVSVRIAPGHGVRAVDAARRTSSSMLAATSSE